MNMVKICFISYNLFSNKGGILEYVYSCMRFADRCGMLSLIACFLSSKWTCFRNMLDNQCGKRLLYFIETVFWDKLDNCFISYSPFTSVATGRYLIVFIDFPKFGRAQMNTVKPLLVFYIFFPPLPAQQKDTFHLAKPGFGVSDICSLVVWSPWIEFGWINFHVIFEIGSVCPTVRKRWDAGSMGAEESLFFQPKTESLRPKKQFINQIHMFSWWWAALLWQCLCM